MVEYIKLGYGTCTCPDKKTCETTGITVGVVIGVICILIIACSCCMRKRRNVIIVQPGNNFTQPMIVPHSQPNTTVVHHVINQPQTEFQTVNHQQPTWQQQQTNQQQFMPGQQNVNIMPSAPPQQPQQTQGWH